MNSKFKKIILFVGFVVLFAVFISNCSYKKQTSEDGMKSPEIKNEVKENDSIDVEETTNESENSTITENEPVFYLSDYERLVVECIVMGESSGEPYNGQIAVAQCILNACLKDDLQPSEVRTKYKYSGWNEHPNESVKDAVRLVFDNGYKITNEYILYFYASRYTGGSWHETQKFVMEIGGHRFFAEWDD